MTALTVSGLSKAYKRYPNRLGRLKDWLVPARASRAHLKWVLQDVHLSVQPGEALGLVGANGAGKSTLLKIIAGTTRATTGEVRTSGRVSAILELGLGFHPELTGRQNALLAIQLQGCSELEAHAVVPEIAAFAEIESAFDQPIRTYSSGMQMRLAFSVATARRPDVLIVDEALSVGDAYFQHKSIERIRAFRQQGTALLIVSHDKQVILSMCDRAALLHEGRITMTGRPEAVLDYYNAALANHQKQSLVQESLTNGQVRTVSGTGEASIESIELVDLSGRRLQTVFVGQSIRARLVVRVHTRIESLVLGFGIKDRLGQMIFGTNTHHTGQSVMRPSVGVAHLFEVDFRANLGVGSYTVHASLVESDSHIERNYHWVDGALLFDVINKDKPVFVGCSWNELSFRISQSAPSPDISDKKSDTTAPQSANPAASPPAPRATRKLVIVDVGCRGGVADKFPTGNDRFQIYGFDPDAGECDRLTRLGNDHSVSWVPVALARDSGLRTLFLTQDPACSSLLQPDPRLTDTFPALNCARQVGETSVPTISLDRWAEQSGVTHVDYIKLDTQGSELEILEGGTQVLRSVRCLEIEVEFNPIYREQALFSDVDLFLRAHGFVLWKLTNQVHYSKRGKPERLLGVDRVYYDDLHAVPHPVYGGQLYWANAHYIRGDVLNGAGKTAERAALDAELFLALGMSDVLDSVGAGGNRQGDS